MAARFTFCLLLTAFACIQQARIAHAQDMEPRAFSIAPVGTNFLGGGSSYSSGGVSLDSALPVTDVKAYISSFSLGYSRYFSLAGRTASWAVVLPYVDASLSGNVGEERQKIYREGAGDMRFRLSTNLIGGPALTPAEFAVRTPDTTVGLSLMITAPTGEYTSQHLINIGSNRWTFKPEIGFSQPIGNWFVEGSSGVSFFTNNDNFYGGRERTQDPIASFQGHAGYNFRPGLWLAGNAIYWTGGETEVDGVSAHDSQSNSRYGLTLSVPISQGFSCKLAWSKGYVTRVGGNFDTILAALQYRWFDS